MNRPLDERGAIGGIEGLAFGILVFAFGTLMVLNTWAIVDGNIAASAAAREAARAYVEAPNGNFGQAAANQAAETAMSGHSHLATTVAIESGTSSGEYRRCAPVRATVTVSIPRVALPLIGARGGTVKVSASHVEVIDPYRSGISGAAVCAI